MLPVNELCVCVYVHKGMFFPKTDNFCYQLLLKLIYKIIYMYICLYIYGFICMCL